MKPKFREIKKEDLPEGMNLELMLKFQNILFGTLYFLQHEFPKEKIENLATVKLLYLLAETSLGDFHDKMLEILLDNEDVIKVMETIIEVKGSKEIKKAILEDQINRNVN